MINWTKEESLEVQSLLQRCKTVVLGTTQSSGEPAIAPVYFALSEPLRLDFVSKSDTQHILNIKNSESVAAAVFEEGESLTEITGIQMSGNIKLLEGETDLMARKNYLNKYASIKSNPFLSKLFDKLPLFSFTPTWVRLTDHQETGIRRREWKSSRP